MTDRERVCRWQNFTVNPAGVVAQKLNGTCHSSNSKDFQVCLQSVLLPVNETGARVPQEMLTADAASFDAVLMMGLENGAKGLKLETMGYNARGAHPKLRAFPFGPQLLPVTADLGKLEIPGLLELAGGEIWSRDAGTFFCNEVLYRTVHTIRTAPIYLHNSNTSLLPAMFVHLPCATSAEVPIPPKEKQLCPTVRLYEELLKLIPEVAIRMVAPNM